MEDGDSNEPNLSTLVPDTLAPTSRLLSASSRNVESEPLGYSGDSLLYGVFAPGIQKRLAEEFKPWSIQQPERLSEPALERWKSERPLACPGIAAGHFEHSKMTSYALLLVSAAETNPGYKFIIFTPEHDRPAYRMTVLDESPEDAHDIFIRREDVGKFFDRQSITKFRVDANEIILFADAGVNNYETDVYFWGNGSFQHQPVDY